MSDIPPHYVIVSQTSLLPDESSRGSTLVHPQIHYQYADDPPTAIPISLPPDAQIIYMDFNPNNTSSTQVRSASSNLVVTDLTISDAVGALPIENTNLVVIGTGEMQGNINPDADPKVVLRDYRERLDILRKIADQDTSLPSAPYIGNTDQ